jgi:FtsZ-interacting cell division protein ZipA
MVIIIVIAVLIVVIIYYGFIKKRENKKTNNSNENSFTMKDSIEKQEQTSNNGVDEDKIYEIMKKIYGDNFDRREIDAAKKKLGL